MSENSNPGAKIGRGMLTISWILVLIFLVLLFGNWEKRQINPNMQVEGMVSDQARTVVLQRNRYGHYVASGTVNGNPVMFLLDTGATNVAVPKKLARKLQLKPGAPYLVSTANGNVEVRATIIPVLQLGPITLHDVRASINPGMEEEDGILLGMSVLKELDFSQKGDELTIVQYLN